MDMAQRGLTAGQARVLATLRAYVAEHGYAPSLREMARLLGVGSTNTVRQYLTSLEAKGHLRRTPGIERSIVLLERAA